MTEEQKQKIERLNAISKRVSDILPFLKRPLLNTVVEKIANSVLTEADIKNVDKKLVFWPQQVGEMAKEALDKKGDLRQGLKAYNDFLKYIFNSEKEYTLEDIQAADVKKFTKFNMVDVRYLGVLFTDGRKFNYILDDLRTVAKKTDAFGKQFDTYDPAKEPKDKKKEVPVSVSW